MRKKLFIILGKSNSSKSSVLRCITGCSVTRENWKLQFLNNDIASCYVSITSPQERGVLGISVEEFTKQLIETNHEYLFITLQSKSSTQQFDGEHYLQSFINFGFEIQTIVCFDADANVLNLSVKQYNTRSVPSNYTASEVRKLWEIL